MNKLIHAGAALVFSSLMAPLLAAGSNPVVNDDNDNTAMGSNAVQAGFNNSANGYGNIGAGWFALSSTTANGWYNIGFGLTALRLNTYGIGNSALGALALLNNQTGGYDTALGWQAEGNNNSGTSNVAVGINALLDNVTGSANTAVGSGALQNATGSYNIAIGAMAGSAVGSGSYSIEIGAVGSAPDSNVIRIGTAGQQNAAYIQGVYGVQVGRAYGYVVIDNIGHLGTWGSAERFKTDVKSMELDEKTMERLRPVSFHLKSDPAGPLHYGLIAEEVDKIDPSLVVRDEHGRIDGIHYEELTPMLLKEIQQQRNELAARSSRLGRLRRQITQLQAALEESNKARAMVAER
jgi:hypothetical protein